MSKRQAERSEATRTEIVRVARASFAAEGYAETSIDEVAEQAGVTKGAVYHHFDSKRELFQAVFETLEQELCDRIVAAAAGAGSDVWRAIELGVDAFLEAAGEPALQRIVLVEGPTVLGWETWREIDERYGYSIVRMSLEAAMDAGVMERRPVDPLARIFLASLSEAALQIARASDPARARDEMSTALWSLFQSLRRPAPD